MGAGVPDLFPQFVQGATDLGERVGSGRWRNWGSLRDAGYNLDPWGGPEPGQAVALNLTDIDDHGLIAQLRADLFNRLGSGVGGEGLELHEGSEGNQRPRAGFKNEPGGSGWARDFNLQENR